MPLAELIVSAFVPLLVALFNFLVAGYALATGLRDKKRIVFAAGPAGVGVWALAWFSSVFNPDLVDALRHVGTAGAVLAVFGFAVDAWADVSERRARFRIGLGLSIAVALVAAGAFALRAQLEAHPLGLVARAFALACVAMVVLARARDFSHPDDEPRQFARRHLFAAAGTAIGFGMYALIALFTERAMVDVLLFVTLLAEVFALIFIVHGRVEVRVLLSRAVAYALLTMLVAGLAALALAPLGYDSDPVAVAVTVAVALLASALFMGTSDRITRAADRLMFPNHARTERALAASRGELRALRRRLERVEKLAITGELAASVAHEIKNPLAPIRGYAQMLEGRLEAVAEPQRASFAKGLRIIREETDRIDGRVAELLTLARGERTTSSRDERFDVHAVVADVAAIAAGEPGLGSIVTRLDPSVMWAAGDPDEMRGALLNLVKNAAEAMQDGGGSAVEIETKRQEDRVVIIVRDDGPGVPPAVGERAFAAFYTTKAGGTGLGLAIVRAAVEAAGGTVTIGPRTDTRGAEVRIEVAHAPKAQQP